MSRPKGLLPRTSGTTGVLLVLGALALSGLVAQRYAPTPNHPRTTRWYKRLDKPGWKPPDVLFGAIWPLLQSLASWGAWRLMRAPQSRERDEALGLWAAVLTLVTGWAKLFFGKRSITGGLIDAVLLTLAAAAFVERASRVDRKAALAGVPITLWSAFGTLMTENLRERNPRLDGSDRRL
jgi:tryptophan-rich sensory protein